MTLLLIPAATAFGIGVYVATSTSDAGVAPGRVALVADGEMLAKIGVGQAERLAAGKGTLPIDARHLVKRGPLVRTFEVDEPLLRRRLGAATDEGAVVRIPYEPVASRIKAPIVKQAYRNNCETAALSMLLATVGVSEGQRGLQDEISTAGPLDPQIDPQGETVWGDPELGYVGRPKGGGTAGGFGAYEGPVMELASRWAEPTDLSGRSPGAVYRRLLTGDAIMVWVGLSDGPHETWRSPEGNEVTVNYGEHTVVLTGIEGDRLYVNDPIDGQRKVWSKAEFEQMWALLDRRAVSL